ncbi:MAG: DUF3727 domain-containing protein, partial [Clostridia bacterium]|nr:DUF3727 domain-containing protein [Clostridia bacterium]
QSKTISVRVKNTAENTQLRGMTGSLTTDVIKAVINSMSVELVDDPKTLTYPLTLDDVKANYAVYLGWNFAPLELLADESKVTVALKDGGELSAGTLTFLFTYTDGALTQTSDPVDIEISKGTFNVDDITFVGNTEKIVYDGQPHKLEISGTLPDGVSVEYTVTGQTATEFTNAGNYVYTASFKHENGNYNAITKTLTATLTISQATYVMPTGYQTSKQATYTGSQIALPANWISGLPSGVSVKYYEVVNNVVSATEFTGATNIDVYNLKAVFTVADPVNYEVPDPVDLTFEITKKNVYTDNLSFTVTGAEESGNNAYTATYSPDTTVSFELGGNLVKTDGTEVTPALTYTYERQADGAWIAASAADLKNAGTYRVTVAVKNEDATYADVDNKVITLTIKKADYTLDEALFKGATVEFDGKDHTLAISGELPDWITEVVYTVEGQDGTSFSAVGTYDFTATFKHENGNYNDVQPLYATLKINTAGVALDVTFDGDTVTYDGGIHMIALNGTLPAWVTVTYYVGEEEFTGAVNAGTYEVVARFTVDESLYNKPEEMTATLTIEAAVYELTGVTFENGAFVYDGEAHSIFVGGSELPEWITVSYTGNEVSEIGTHTVTAKFTHENGNYKTIGDMTAQIVISKAKIALPVYKGTLSYSGDEIKPTAADFEGFDSALMSFVESKTVAGLNAGTYKAVFALTDTERYEWATATTLKKALFAVVYDEVVLEDYEAAVEWNIAKAKISATKANGKLPVFASESFSGSFADIVGLKYYTDETCAEEISADELAYSTKYYVKAELLDGTNFELDESATVFAKTAFEYTTPEKQLTIWEKIVKFVVTNWLWIVIAVVALILLITIIACAARASRKKREREEQRRLEEKAERERREEREEQRRREEREERMAARMAMPQMMPQMPPMGQMQAAQPMAAGGAVGGASSNELAELKAEMAAMKASQDMAKELAIRAEMTAREMALRAEQNAVMRSDINALRGGDQTSGIIGISIDKLTELVEKTVERVLSGKEKPAAAPPESGAATVPECPPDAVMTTVTTTKIDTTKKPAQTAQTPAPAVR